MMEFKHIKHLIGEKVDMIVDGAEVRGILSVIESDHNVVDESMVRLFDATDMKEFYGPYWVEVSRISAIRKLEG